LKIGIAFAAENPTAGETIFVNRTFIINLVTAPPDCHFNVIPSVAKRSRGIFFNRFLHSAPAAVLRQQDAGAPVEMTIRPFNFLDEINHLRRRHKQPMAERLKVTAFAANAARPGLCAVGDELLIKPLIDSAHLLDNFSIGQLFIHSYPFLLFSPQSEFQTPSIKSEIPNKSQIHKFQWSKQRAAAILDLLFIIWCLFDIWDFEFVIFIYTFFLCVLSVFGGEFTFRIFCYHYATVSHCLLPFVFVRGRKMRRDLYPGTFCRLYSSYPDWSDCSAKTAIPGTAQAEQNKSHIPSLSRLAAKIHNHACEHLQ
jgi:hypothetical protein